jgi:hypothetical protein
MMQVYQPPLVAKLDDSSHFDLWSLKDVEIDGRKRQEVFFAAVIIQKGYVGFYFMPVYAAPAMSSVFKPELLKRLKGKSCFHLKSLDQALAGQITSALKAGFELYQQRGWV